MCGWKYKTNGSATIGQKIYLLKLSLSRGQLKLSVCVTLARKESSQNLDISHIYLGIEN